MIKKVSGNKAGGYYGTQNTSYYLYNGQYCWTMTPLKFIIDRNIAYLFYEPSHGGNGGVDTARGVRPVINLRADVQITGSGTRTDPFVVN